ncbi:MAG: glycosyltransferase [Deltaproteobacteria bacterium]|jgi:glycosyltransferase EpsH|nr:glycosyltransferase [Deltaproteobacteria bacterium]
MSNKINKLPPPSRKKAAVSVIVANYNNAKYLRDAFDSILFQTFQDWEAIIVDDGSTDNSREIIQEYAQKDARIIPLFQDNAGVSAARNAGFDVACGEFVYFLDSDDCLTPTALEVLYNLAMMNNVNLVIGSFIRVEEDFKIRNFPTFGHDKWVVIDNISKHLATTAWECFYRRDFLLQHNIRFYVGMRPGQDVLFSTCVLLAIDRFIQSKSVIVYYRKSETSIVLQLPTNKSLDSFVMFLKELIRMLDHGLVPKEKIKWFKRNVIPHFLFEFIRSIQGADKDLLNKARKICRICYNSKYYVPHCNKLRHCIGIYLFMHGINSVPRFFFKGNNKILLNYMRFSRHNM